MFAGMCGTDLHIVQGEFGGCSVVNVTLGHEFSGRVIECGKNVHIQPGTKVAIDPNRYSKNTSLYWQIRFQTELVILVDVKSVKYV